MLLLCLAASAFTGCGQTKPDSNTDSSGDLSGPPKIVVSTWVLKELTEGLVAGGAEVVCLETSLKAQRLSDSQISELQSADLTIVNGAGMEPWLQTVSLPRSRLLDSTASSSAELLQADGSITHQHGPNGPKDPAGLIHSTWLSPRMLLRQCETIKKRLSTMDIDGTRVSEGHAANELRISQLTAKIEALQRVSLTVLTSSTETGWLIHELKWKQRVIGVDYMDFTEASAAEQKLQPYMQARLVLTTDLEAEATIGGLSAVQIDLCLDSKKNVSLFDRLEGNLTRLEEAVGVLSGEPSRSSETSE